MTEGLLDLAPNRGAWVARLSEAEIEDMVEVVAGLEATAADLAWRRLTALELEAIETKHRAMVDAFAQGDDPTYFVLNREIHDAIMRGAQHGSREHPCQRVGPHPAGPLLGP